MALNDVSGAGFSLIPDKTYVKAVLSVESPKPGKASVGMECLTKDGNGRYLNLKAVISEGKYSKRNLFTTLCTVPNGSEGHAAWEGNSDRMMKSILEQANNANKQTNPQGYRLAQAGAPHPQLVQAVISAINGKEVIIKVVEQAGKGGFDDSNSFTVVPKWDDKGQIHKEFAGYSPNGNGASAPVAQMNPTGFTIPGNSTGYNGGGFGQVAQPQHAPQTFQQPVNPMASPPPGFIDQNNANDIPFDNN